MAETTRISQLSAHDEKPADDDMLLMVDVSDDTQSAEGSTKKITYSDLTDDFITSITLPQSATWNTTYTTVTANSATWTAGGSDYTTQINSLSSQLEQANTTIIQLSALIMTLSGFHTDDDETSTGTDDDETSTGTVSAGSFTNTYSLDLDGSDDYLSISASSYSISGNKSFSAWVKPTTGSYHYLWGYGSNLYALYFDSAAVSIRMWPSGQGGGSGRTYQRMVSPVTFSLNSWYNITITGDGTTLKLYVNGQPAATTYTDNDDWYFETALRAGNTGSSFSGFVDEFAFFNSTLSSSEVSAIYGSGSPSSLSSYSPHLWWRMGDNDSGTGTTVTDQGSGSNDATLTNGPTFSTEVPS